MVGCLCFPQRAGNVPESVTVVLVALGSFNFLVPCFSGALAVAAGNTKSAMTISSSSWRRVVFFAKSRSFRLHFFCELWSATFL